MHEVLLYIVLFLFLKRHIAVIINKYINEVYVSLQTCPAGPV